MAADCFVLCLVVLLYLYRLDEGPAGYQPPTLWSGVDGTSGEGEGEGGANIYSKRRELAFHST